MARTFMVHVSLHLTEWGVDDVSLWGFAVNHASWIHNRIPDRTSGLIPLELLTKAKADHRDLLVPLCGVVHFLFLTLSCGMARKSLTGINNPALASLWAFLMSIHP
ncbi:hypothetical protein ACHAW6_003404 [Cyclotella cf. meneghiniana]